MEVQLLCLSREGRAFCISRTAEPLFPAVRRDVANHRRFIFEDSSMRTRSQHLLTSAMSIAVLVPALSGAQVRTPSRVSSSGQPWQCLPTDSARAFNRTLRADSLARQRAAGGAPAGTTPITGGTGRSHEYPEYDVVLARSEE